jgi:hypothetical protein
MSASFAHIVETEGAIDVGVDARFASGMPPHGRPFPGPALSRSLAVPASYPTHWRVTPAADLDYDVAVGASATALNQLLMAKTSRGDLDTEITSFDGTPTTAAFLGTLIPQFTQLPPQTPLRIRARFTMAPVFTGHPGPHGELAELAFAQLSVEIVETVHDAKGVREIVWLHGVLDADLGIDLAFDPAGALALELGTPVAEDLAFFVLGNAIGASVAQVEAIVPAILAAIIEDRESPLASFPVPAFPPLTLAPTSAVLENGYLILFSQLAS